MQLSCIFTTSAARMLTLPFITLLLTAGPSWCEELVSVSRIEAPTFIERGDSATLKCVYNMGACTLHSIQWDHNADMFFLYVSREMKNKTVPLKPPVIVDEEASTGETVVLSNARLRDGGRYTCTVLTKDCEFQEARISVNITVGVLPEEDPVIEPLGAVTDGVAPLLTNYKPGDSLTLVCTAPPSYPEPTLQWLINEKKVPKSALLTLDPLPRSSDGLYNTRMGLQITLTKEHFREGAVQLECSSQIGTVSSKRQSRKLVDADFTKPSNSAPAQHQYGVISPLLLLLLLVTLHPLL